MKRVDIVSPTQEEELRLSHDPKYQHLHEDLHVEITAFAPPAEAHARIAYALTEVRKYLIPDSNDEIRQEQMREMEVMSGLGEAVLQQHYQQQQQQQQQAAVAAVAATAAAVPFPGQVVGAQNFMLGHQVRGNILTVVVVSRDSRWFPAFYFIFQYVFLFCWCNTLVWLIHHY